MSSLNSISILGCGWLGLPLGKSLVQAGYPVKGSVTKNSKLDLLNQNGIRPFLISLDDKPDKWSDIFFDSDIFILAVPPSKTNLDGLKSFIHRLSLKQDTQVILFSSTGIYKEQNSEIDEQNKIALDTQGKLFQIEQLLSDSLKQTPIIMRLGGLYGYDRNPLNFLNSKTVLSNPNGRINFVYRDDVIQLVHCILGDPKSGIYNCCADEHPTKKEFYSSLCLQAGLDLPAFQNVIGDSWKIISNQKIRTTYSFSFTPLHQQ